MRIAVLLLAFLSLFFTQPVLAAIPPGKSAKSPDRFS
jgi:hypothetical protein